MLLKRRKCVSTPVVVILQKQGAGNMMRRYTGNSGKLLKEETKVSNSVFIALLAARDCNPMMLIMVANHVKKECLAIQKTPRHVKHVHRIPSLRM